MLTIHLIVKNNERTLKDSIQSILPLDANIVAGYIGGSQDKTIAICYEYGVTVKYEKWNENYGEIRNNLISDGWNMYLEPWEVLASGHDEIIEAINNPPTKYSMQCWRGDIITRGVRLWHSKMKAKFVAPVFEGLPLTGSQELPAHIYSSGTIPYDAHNIVDKWIDENPLSHNPYYYKSSLLLSDGEYKEFLQVASNFIFHEKHGMKSIMTRHHMAMVYLYVFHDAGEAMRKTLECIAVKPDMAEFWCLLGDIYHERQRYGKARKFYQNAIDLGSFRLTSDKWPINYTKYKQYPESMMELCNRTKLTMNT